MTAFIIYCSLAFFLQGMPELDSTGVQSIPEIKVDYISELSNSNSDTLYILNFWATWCKPCVKELPHFEKINQNYKDKPVKVILISLDRPKLKETVLKGFIEKNRLKSTVLLLNEKDPNYFIPKISDNWQGSIPATLFLKPDRDIYNFHEKEFNYKELKNITNQLIN